MCCRIRPAPILHFLFLYNIIRINIETHVMLQVLYFYILAVGGITNEHMQLQ